MTKMFKRADYHVAIQYGLVNLSNQKQSSQTSVIVCVVEHVGALEKLLFIVIKYVIEMNQLQMQTFLLIVKEFISLCFPKLSKINALICKNVLLDYLLVLLYFSCAAPSSACEGLQSDNLF